MTYKTQKMVERYQALIEKINTKEAEDVAPERESEEND
jgi:hypothetical protein